MKTISIATFFVAAVGVGLLTIGCEQPTAPVSQILASPAQSGQSIDKEPPGVHFLQFTTPVLKSNERTVTSYSGTQPGFAWALCSNKTDTWIGSSTTTYGNQVEIWHDCLQNWDTTTFSVSVLNLSTFGAVQFDPSEATFKHPPTVDLNYRNFGITDSAAKFLKIYWWDPINLVWTVMPVTVNVHPGNNQGYIEFQAPHFSRYAFCR